jgi:hypothetical protein
LIYKKELFIFPIFTERDFVPDPKLVFVLMPFDEPWSDRIWEMLQETSASKGLRIERADNRYGPIVMEDVWSGIMECGLIIADVTGWNPNVFYELGIAHTVGKETILISQRVNRFPFDTQGLRHLLYEDTPAGLRALREQLINAVDYNLGRISRPPKAKSRKLFLRQLAKFEVDTAWHECTGGWNPSLPPVRYLKERALAGAILRRMRNYAFALNKRDFDKILTEFRLQWPDEWGNFSREEIHSCLQTLLGTIGAWRPIYRKRLKEIGNSS